MNLDLHPQYLRVRAERDALLRERDALALELAALRSALRHLIEEYRNGHVQTEQPETWALFTRLAAANDEEKTL